MRTIRIDVRDSDDRHERVCAWLDALGASRTQTCGTQDAIIDGDAVTLMQFTVGAHGHRLAASDGPGSNSWHYVKHQVTLPLTALPHEYGLM